MNIRTEMYKTFGGDEWHAWDDDTYDGAEDSRSPMGWGKTEKEAIEDLKEKINEANI
jgi:hypothetical protein